MAQIVTHHDAFEQVGELRHWTYNAMDCCTTRRVHDVLKPRLTQGQETTYRFELACQGPALQMMLRGVAVDEAARQAKVVELTQEFGEQAEELDKLIGNRWTAMQLETGRCRKSARKDGKHKWPRQAKDGPKIEPSGMNCETCGATRLKRSPFNPLSDDQTAKLLYGVLQLPEEHNKHGKVSTDKEILDRIERNSVKARPFVRGVKLCRQTWKQVSMLEAAKNGRYWSSFNVGAADSGRWSSSSNPYGAGGNAQNVTEKLRNVFIADPNKWLFYADLEQAESNVVAHLAGDEEYIEAHRSGDVHTFVSRLLWPDELAWTGDLKRDKKLCEGAYPKWDSLNSYRTNSKRNQHGANYVKTYRGFARDAHIPEAAAKECFDRYFDTFRGIRPWHHHIARVVMEWGEITTPLGRRRQFFGRRYNARSGGLDGHVHRQAVAFQPQSMVADILDTALWHVWNELDPEELWVLAQVHDAILGETRVASKDEKVIRRLVELMTMPVTITDWQGNSRVMRLGVDVKVGRNWAKASNMNEEGMR